MSVPVEARELELVGKVEMKIALAKDDKLESILKPYLPPLLLKLASDHQSVRNKVRTTTQPTRDILFEVLTWLVQVISTCQHIKIRLAGNQ